MLEMVPKIMQETCVWLEGFEHMKDNVMPTSVPVEVLR